MLFNVWHNSQTSKTTIMANNVLAAKKFFALRYGWLSNESGYMYFIDSLNTKKVY